MRVSKSCPPTAWRYIHRFLRTSLWVHIRVHIPVHIHIGIHGWAQKDIKAASLRQNLDGPQSLKWVLADPLQKKLPDSCSMWVNSFEKCLERTGSISNVHIFSMASKTMSCSYAFLFQTAIFSLTLWHFSTKQEGASFYRMTGLGPLPQALYNGEPFKLEQLNAEELETNVLHRMMDTTINLQREVLTVGKHL